MRQSVSVGCATTTRSRAFVHFRSFITIAVGSVLRGLEWRPRARGLLSGLHQVPIFSNRSIADMLDHVTAILGPARKAEWLSRLNSNADSAIATEWEIAALYCLSKQGTIDAAPRQKGVADLEVIYTSRNTGTRVAVEVTSVSDKSYYETNPTQAFSEELLKVTLKHNIHKIGGIRSDIGDVRGSRGPILGLPPARALSRFFNSSEFTQFIADIKALPMQPHVLEFKFNEARSRLIFSPGRPTGGGGHIVHNLLFDPYKNPITSRLNTKDDQIARARLDLPAVVILCDADCHALHATLPSFAAQSAGQVIHTFLNVRGQSRRINGVSLWPVFIDYSPMSGKPPRYFTDPKHIKNVAQTHFPLDDATLAELSTAARHLPRIARSPNNARRKSKWPLHYGGFSVRGSNPMKIRMSLLSLQYLLSGHIPANKFVEGNAELMKQFKLATDRGFIISSVGVEHCPDEDDDWLEIELEQTAPTHVLREPSVT